MHRHTAFTYEVESAPSGIGYRVWIYRAATHRAVTFHWRPTLKGALRHAARLRRRDLLITC